MASKNNEKPTHSSCSLETRLVHGKHFTEAWNFQNHVVPPMTSNTTYRLQSVERGAQGFVDFGEEKLSSAIWVYDRLNEPNSLMLEEQLTYLEQGRGTVTFSSGMGAISGTCLATLKKGDLILSDSTIYGCTFSLFKNWLPKFGIQTQWANFGTLKALDNPPENLRLIYLESIANPNLKVADLKAICTKVKELNSSRSQNEKILVAVDNTFATPMGCNPLTLGADFALHSLTKNISGFGTELGGAVTVASKEWITPLRLTRKDFGAVLNSKSAWHILNHGLPTLKLRFNTQQHGAKIVSDYLNQHSKVETVLYPGLESHPYHKQAKEVLSANTSKEFQPGFMVAFTLKGSEEDTVKFVNHLAQKAYSITLAVSLGLTKTLVEVPRLMTHSVMDEREGAHSDIPLKLVRLSVGLENPTDLIHDLEQALQTV